MKTELKLTKANYLSSCDLINKYNLKSYYERPTINKIIVRFSLRDFEKTAENLVKRKFTAKKLKVHACLIFLILFNRFPKITLECGKRVRNSKIESESEIFLQTTLSNNDEINSFLSNLQFEKNFFYETVYRKFLKQNYNPVFSRKAGNVYNYNTKIAANSFFALHDFYNHTHKNVGIQIEKLKIDFDFVYVNVLPEKNIGNLIKNVSFYG